MQLTEQTAGGSNFIRRIETDALVIGDKHYRNSLVIAPDAIIDDWPPTHADQLREADLEVIFNLRPDLVILGTGPRQVFPDARVMAAFLSRGIGVEAMDTAAACRTFNVLVSEDRRAVAGLIQPAPETT